MTSDVGTILNRVYTNDDLEFSQGIASDVLLEMEDGVSFDKSGIETVSEFVFENTSEKYVRILANMTISQNEEGYPGTDDLNSCMIFKFGIQNNGAAKISSDVRIFPKVPTYQGTIAEGGGALYTAVVGGFETSPSYQLSFDCSCILPVGQFSFYFNSPFAFEVSENSSITIAA